MQGNDQIRVAIHEAGHCVAALLLGRSFGCVMLENNPHGMAGLAGSGELRQDAKPRIREAEEEFARTQTPRELFEDSVVYVAGDVAVRLHNSVAHLAGFASTSPDGWLAEVAGAAFIGDRFCDDTTTNAWTMLAACAARRLLGPHLQEIRAIANALLVRRRLTPADVAEVFAMAIQDARKAEADRKQAEADARRKEIVAQVGNILPAPMIEVALMQDPAYRAAFEACRGLRDFAPIKDIIGPDREWAEGAKATIQAMFR